MEAHLNPELQAKLERVAAGNRRGPGEYVQQLVESYLDDGCLVSSEEGD